MTRKKTNKITDMNREINFEDMAGGFDGLYSGDCACFLNDLIPYGGNFSLCEPGTKPDCEGMEIIKRSKKP